MKKLLAFVLLFCSVTLITSDTLKVQSEVETVVSGGYWDSGKKDGRYRIIIIKKGWEHIYSNVFLEWVCW